MVLTLSTLCDSLQANSVSLWCQGVSWMARAGLSPDKVVAIALSTLDQEGPDGLTLARVAERAGVATPSLYKHVGGLPDLRLRIARTVLGELAAASQAAVVGVARDDAVRALMRAYRSYVIT